MPPLTLQQAFDLAVQHHQAGRLREAEQIYRHILAQQPEHVEAMHNLGVLANQVGRNDMAADLYRRVIALRPNYAEAHSNLGNALRETGQLEAAIAAYRQAIALRPSFPDAHNNLGNALHDKGQLEEAMAAFRQAIALKPNYAEAHYNLGCIRTIKGQLDEAIAAYRQALVFRPNYAEAYVNLGNALHDKGQLEEAIVAFRQAIQIKPDAASVHWNLALLLLGMGRFAEGWEEYEWRLKDEPRHLRRDFAPPQWKGEDLAGKTLLLHVEGGYGDAFHFIRYVPLLRGRAKKMVLECQPTVVRMFCDLPSIDQVIARGQGLPAFDYHIPLTGLPRLFKTDLTNTPNSVPYLKVPTEYQSRWRGRVQDDGRLKVGLVWAGSGGHTVGNDVRTRGLDVMAPLGQTPRVHFFSLQTGPESSLPRPPELELTDFTQELNDFADTAALIENLDLVISVDTSVAHLAGALAKPVWVLIPFSSDFRWLRERTDSPWYPTMRLFRQTTAGDWTGVIGRVVEALAAFGAKKLI